MTRKLYYNCPIEAAYMAKNFGARFKDEEFLYYAHSLIGDYFDFNYFNQNHPYKNYIHPNSLSIFEPQVGDTLKGSPFGVVSVNGTRQMSAEAQLAINEAVGNTIIIQRNNKPFIMPQEEKEEND